MLYVLQKLEFSVCTFAEDGCAEGFHDLLDRDGRASELILCRAAQENEKVISECMSAAYHTSPKAPTGSLVGCVYDKSRMR